MSVPFLTELDSRAAIKGSRDPLGLQPIWVHFGRRAVGNLTTVTSSLRNFTTLLLGLYVADDLIERGDCSEEQRVDIFLRVEQLAGYSRFAHGADGAADGILGVTRIRRRLEAANRVQISAARDEQILGNQKTYGLWGLYTVAARNSGLIEREEPRLTPLARDFVEKQYIGKLTFSSRRSNELGERARKDNAFYPDGADKKLSQALAAVLGPKLTRAEKDFYTEALLRARTADEDATAGRQEQLWESFREWCAEDPERWTSRLTIPELDGLIRHAAKTGREPLADVLTRIRGVEPALAAASSLFSFALQRNQKTLSQLGAEVREVWGSALRHLDLDALAANRPGMATAAGEDGATRLLEMANLLRSGSYGEAVEVALAQNEAVMKARGGAPWAGLARSRLEVRLRAEDGGLYDPDILPDLAVHSYFLPSLKSMTAFVEGAVA